VRLLRSGSAALATLALLLAGCASTPPSSLVDPDLLVALDVAAELERGPDRESARCQLEAIAALAPPEIADEARLRRCATWAGEDATAAEGCYAESVAAMQTASGGALAELYAATLALDRGDPAAETAIAAVITRHAAESAARRALSILRGLARERGGADAELALLHEIAAALRPAVSAGGEGANELCLEATIEAAGLAVTRATRAAEALGWLDGIEALVGQGRWRDDWLWWRSRALVLEHRDEEAIAALDALIDARVSSWLVGSYDSPLLDDALLAVGEIEERRGRVDAARRAYRRVLDETPDSRLVDDAAFAAARLGAAQGDRAALQRFCRDFPESRHLPAARALLEGTP
jgi:tetratricopeptide (TPR) repeat protein